VTIVEAARALRARTVSSVELTQAALDSVSRLNGKLNAFLTVTAEHAIEQARAADDAIDRGAARGPLHGVPVAVKDVFATKGVRTTIGSKLFTDHVPDQDAAVVEKLDAAGAVSIGKLGMHEFAYGITSNNPHFGAVRNPWNTDCVPGGSSGGSGSAVGAEIVFMAMGSDTGGSIRIPAAFCGTVGLKPTTGRVSRYGVLPLDFTLDHMGPLTRSVRDAAIVLEALAGYDPRDDSSSRVPVGAYVPPDGVSIAGLRVGIPESFFFDRLDEDVERAVRGVAARCGELGARVSIVRVPDFAAINAVGRVILLSEASAMAAPYLHRRRDIGADVLALFDQGRLLPATDYVNAQRLRRLSMREFAAVWESADVLLTPTTPVTAPRIGQTETTLGGVIEDVRLASTRLVRGINVLGLPALSIPCGLAANGMPMSAQIIGRPFDEATVLRAGAALEDSGITALGRKPPVL
jgi:aspartyl-tRNA(Asn)/glutamyl-tRNA(Gln) amidotransferase subunit A